METTNIGAAKTQFSALIHKVEAGDDVIIARDGRAVARITRVESAGRRHLGVDNGLGFISDDFDAPLPNDLLASFSGETSEE